MQLKHISERLHAWKAGLIMLTSAVFCFKKKQPHRYEEVSCLLPTLSHDSISVPAPDFIFERIYS